MSANTENPNRAWVVTFELRRPMRETFNLKDFYRKACYQSLLRHGVHRVFIVGTRIVSDRETQINLSRFRTGGCL
ncbi:MAG: hypothetical protein MSG64_06280 [Pyrinomonadaceae bacterium MAG19_C2-C3]|nr:hypothetical protein [Pyrinomonadaceae bacterium MAG19_C2-C3]